MVNFLKLSPAPLLTFAIPFYSGLAFLRRCLASALRQNEPAWQLLVCDDAGPEQGVADLVASYRDPRLSYHRNDRNLGMAGNWNRCLDLAATDLVTLLHADDELLPNYAGLMLHAAARHPRAAAFFCNARIIDEHGRPRFSFPDYYKRFLRPRRAGASILSGQAAIEALLHGNFIMCPTVCYRKNQLGARRFATDWKMVQDLEFFTRLLLGGESLVGLDAVAYAYRRHPGNATTAYTRSLLRFREEAALFDLLGREASRRGWRRTARIAGRRTILQLNLLYCILQDVLAGRFRQAWLEGSFLVSLRAGRPPNRT